MPKPEKGTYFEYFSRYIDQVPESDLAAAFKGQRDIVNNYFDSISEEKAEYAYAPGKWTIKELLQHVIDAERIFNYRALSFARKEKASLPSFEEDDYAANSDANRRSWKSLCEELKAVRRSTEMLFESFTEAMLNSSGIANDKPATALSIGFTILGHLYHHKSVIESRYINAVPAV